MKGWLLTCICLLGSLLPVDAQQINVEDFTRLKRPLWKRSKVTVDKQLAIMDLYSSEKGFQFTADGKTAVEAEEGEGVITLKMAQDALRMLEIDELGLDNTDRRMLRTIIRFYDGGRCLRSI